MISSGERVGSLAPDWRVRRWGPREAHAASFARRRSFQTTLFREAQVVAKFNGFVYFNIGISTSTLKGITKMIRYSKLRRRTRRGRILGSPIMPSKRVLTPVGEDEEDSDTSSLASPSATPTPRLKDDQILLRRTSTRTTTTSRRTTSTLYIAPRAQVQGMNEHVARQVGGPTNAARVTRSPTANLRREPPQVDAYVAFADDLSD